jgi:hypothetical protein
LAALEIQRRAVHATGSFFTPDARRVRAGFEFRRRPKEQIHVNLNEVVVIHKTRVSLNLGPIPDAGESVKSKWKRHGVIAVNLFDSISR